MARWDITGTWTGQYSYHPGPMYPSLPPPVVFTLTARAGWFGSFRGSVQDDPASVPAGEAPVSGRVSRWSVRFEKRYPTMWAYHVGRFMTFREYLETEYGMPLDEDVPSSPILYRGKYDPVEEVMSGTWEILPAPIGFYSGGWARELTAGTGSGDWHARRTIE